MKAGCDRSLQTDPLGGGCQAKESAGVLVKHTSGPGSGMGPWNLHFNRHFS